VFSFFPYRSPFEDGKTFMYLMDSLVDEITGILIFILEENIVVE
jgi:hypothetical protein